MNDKVPMMSKPMMNPPPLTGPMMKPPPMMMNPPPPQAPVPPPQMIMNPQQMMNRGYGMWGHPPPQQPPPMELQLQYQNPNPMQVQGVGVFGKPLGKHQLGPRNNWKGKKVNNKGGDRRMEMAGWNRGGVGGGFNPPSLNDLQSQNRVKTRRYFQKNHYNNNVNKNNNNNNNMGKFAPRNTSSFIMRSKKSGGIAELVSPCPVTPSVLPTPKFSPSREVLGDMAKEEWGVDGYGSMNGFIRLRSPGNDGGEDDDGSSGSDVEEHVEVERRLDHDLSRFEMIYPNYGTIGVEYNNNVLGNRVDDQDNHIAQMEDENLMLKERLFLMEREMADMRRRLQYLERNHVGDYANEEVVENLSENESDSRSGAHSMEDNIEDLGEENPSLDLGSKSKEEDKTTLDNVFKVESGISINKEEQDETKDGLTSEVKVKIQVDTAAGQGQEEKGEEVMVNDVDQNAQVNTDGNNVVEAPEKTIAGEDVCMDEGTPNEGGTEDN